MIKVSSSKETIEKQFESDTKKVLLSHKLFMEYNKSFNISYEYFYEKFEKSKNEEMFFAFKKLIKKDFSFEDYDEKIFINNYWGYNGTELDKNPIFYHVAWSNELITIYYNMYKFIDEKRKNDFEDECDIVTL